MFTTDKNGNKHDVKLIDGVLCIYSDMTEDYAVCTIATGIETLDGELIGAMADVESFAAFTVDLTEAMDVINKENGTKIGVKTNKHGQEYQSIRGDLWTVSKIRESRFDNAVEKKTEDKKLSAREARIEQIASRLANGFDLWDEELIPADTSEENE